ncbi:MAG: hypothetical protein U0703_23750 [Anaerolineae bacterium]
MARRVMPTMNSSKPSKNGTRNAAMPTSVHLVVTSSRMFLPVSQ